MTHEYPCEKIIRVEEAMNTMKDEMRDIKGINQSLTKLTTLMELQMESNKKQDEVLTQQSEALNKLTGTMDKQAEALDRLNDKIDATDKKVEELDKAIKADSDKDKIDFRDMRNKVWWIGVGIAGTALVVKLFQFLGTIKLPV